MSILRFSYSDGSDTLAIMEASIKDGQQELRKGSVIAYGVGDLGLNFYWQGAGFFLLFFYTDVVGLPNLTAGFVIAAGGLVDAVTDPAMGFIADRTRSRFGRYRVYLLFGAPALAVAYAFLFWAPLAATASLAAAAALAAHVLFRVVYTCVSIPYGSLGANLTSDARARTNLAGARMFFGALGGLAVVQIVGGLRTGFSDAQAFVLAGVLAGFLGAIPIFATGLATRERHYASAACDAGLSPVAVGRLAVRNRPFLILIAAMLLITVANVLFAKTVLYLFERILKAPETGAATMAAMTVAPLAALPFWTFVFRRIDKRPGFLAGCAATIASFLLLLVAGDGSLMTTAIACVLISSSFAAFAVGFWSILPDTIDYGHLQSGARIESSLIGIASAVQKIGIATGGVLIGIALDTVGYDAAGTVSTAAAAELRMLIALAPIAATALAAAVFMRYPITADRHEAIVRELSVPAS